MISESCFLIYHNILDTAENYGLFVIEKRLSTLRISSKT